MDFFSFFFRALLSGFSNRVYLLRIMFLFYIVHPGTCATFADARDFLESRYPNRDLAPFHVNLAGLSVNTVSSQDLVQHKFHLYHSLDIRQKLESAIKSKCSGLSKLLDLSYRSVTCSRSSFLCFAGSFVGPRSYTLKASFEGNTLQARRWSSLPKMNAKKKNLQRCSMILGLGKYFSPRNSEEFIFPSYRQKEEKKYFWTPLADAYGTSVSVLQYYANESSAWKDDDVQVDDICVLGFLDIDPYKACKIPSYEN